MPHIPLIIAAPPEEQPADAGVQEAGKTWRRVGKPPLVLWQKPEKPRGGVVRQIAASALLGLFILAITPDRVLVTSNIPFNREIAKSLFLPKARLYNFYPCLYSYLHYDQGS